MNPLKPFPIPVVGDIEGLLGPGSQADDDAPAYLAMPRDMATYNPPALPEPEALAAHAGAVAALQAAHRALQSAIAGAAVEPVDLAGLAPDDRALVNQVLGEGEVAAQVTGDVAVQAQESVFAGVWRVLHLVGGAVVRDTIEIGAVPEPVVEAARADGFVTPSLPAIWPRDVMNAPALLQELHDKSRTWRAGDAAHVVNLTLLPLTDGDSAFLTEQLGQGRVVILSRGYGNCRIVNTRLPRTWRVTYYNSQDIIILDTLEVGAVPEVALAAAEDLEDSAMRLAEVLAWVEGST
jgi:hydrogenase-1 operon protein HyaF